VTAPSRDDALALDAADPLARFPARFVRPDPDLVYLDGNSLGQLPIATVERLRVAVADGWGGDLVRGWGRWIDLPTEVGDRIAPLIGAASGEVVVCDSTTVNLFKAVGAAVATRPGRTELLVPEGEFPTDRYVLEGLARQHGLVVRAGFPADATEQTAVAVASVVDYRTGAITEMAAATAAAHAVGALVCWDLSHAAGAIAVDLAGTDADLAVGCTYKHLCGGPGAPAYLFARRDLQAELAPPIWGWFAQRDQFAMAPSFDPELGVRRFLTGTPNVLGLVSVDSGVAEVAAAGVERLQARGRSLTQLVIVLADEWLTPLGFTVASPRDAAQRGAHVALHHADAHRIGRAAVAAGVVVDVRPPEVVRVGPGPISTTFAEVWDGLDRIRQLVTAGAHLAFDGVPARVT